MGTLTLFLSLSRPNHSQRLYFCLSGFRCNFIHNKKNLRAFEEHDAMANCLLWNFAVLALVASAARAAVIVDTEGVEHHDYNMESYHGFMGGKKQQFDAYGKIWHEMIKKIGSSFEGVEKAAEGMVDNFFEYFTQSVEQVFKDASEFVPHMKEFYNAIPASAVHKLTLDILRTALKQNQDHCGKIDLEYNPLHPGLKAHGARKRRETEEKMNLAKFGKAISSLFTDVDNFVVDYVSKSIPMMCPLIDEWLKEQIKKGEAMDPEDFKKQL